MTILGCGAEMAKLMAVSDEDVQTIEDVLKERLDMGIARPEAQRQAVAEAIAIVTNERAVVMGAIAAKVAALPAPAKTNNLEDRAAAAREKMKNAAAKIAALASKNTRANWTQEEEQQLLPLVIELFDGALELGAVTFQKAVKYVREFLTDAIGSEITNSIPFETLQGAYVHTARKYKDQGASTGKEVMQYESLAELEASAEKDDTGEKDTQNGPSIPGQQGPQALENVAPEENSGAQGGGRVRGSRSGRGSGGKPNGSGIDEPGVSGTRSGGSGSTSVRAPTPRKRGKRAGLGEGGTGTDGGRLSEERGPESVGSDLFSQPTEAVSANNIQATNFRITPELRLGKGGEAEKFRDNIAAIRTLKAIEAEGRRATSAEQSILARYVGWGGLANAFPNPETKQWKEDWKARGAELVDLLTKKEYDLARRSTLDSHYTSETIVSGMWDAARHMGFKGGLTLESSMGSGNFLGLIPQDMAGSTRFVGIEYDSLTARIAEHLYPQETVLNAGLQNVPLPDGAFDLNIGNPPFGDQSLRFQFKPEFNRVSIHNQFFLAGIDALKPGGVQMNVVSRYLLDAMDKTTRVMLAKKARLISAIRLPDTAFKENARTSVVTDIVILQRLTNAEENEMAEAFKAAAAPFKDVKSDSADVNRANRREHERLAALVPIWVEVGKVPDPLGGDPMPVNNWFIDHPELILGTLERSGKMQFKNDITVRPHAQELAELLKQAVATLPENIMQRDQTAIDASLNRHKAMSDGLRIALSGQETGSIVMTKDGTLEQVIERETPEGEYELAKRPLTAKSPWSESLFQDDKGNWYTIEAKLDEAGNKLKVVKNGKATNFNVYERKVFASESDIPKSMLLGEARYGRLVKLVKLRDLMVAQINLETEDAPTDKMEGNRALLAQAYNSFVADHGPISRNDNSALVSNMPDGALVQALELEYRKAITPKQAQKLGESVRPESAKPAPILSERVIPKYEPPTKAASPADALQISLSETGRVDLARMAALLDMTEEAVTDALFDKADKPLIFKDPESGQWVTRNDYLTGQVKKKLHAAQAAHLEKNIAELEAVQPEPWGAENVTVLLGSTFVPPKIYADFIEHVTGRPARVSFSAATNSYAVTASGATQEKVDEFGADGITIAGMVSDILNSKTIRITKTVDDKEVFDEERTALALIKAKQIRSEFSDWVFLDSDRRRTLVDLFNERFNTRVNRQHDGSHLTLPGKVPDAILKMRRHQMNTIWRGISERFMLIDHVVGAGKTFTAIARVMERRRMGLSRKPAIIVPNHMVEQFTADVYRLYPGAKVLAAGQKDFEKKRRRKLFAKIASGDWDVVIIPHSSFGFIGIAQETEERYLEQELAIAEQAIRDAWEEAGEESGGRRKPFNVKQAERLRDKLTARLEGIRGKNRKDRLLTFEQMGIDDLTVDEAHEFKNLFYSSRLTNVKGMGNPSGSQKAFDLYSKVRVLRESPTGTVTFMTGTPISNSAVEMFNMMRYLAADELKELGLEHFDAWRAQFVSTDPGWEPNETGRLKEVNRLGRSWSNMRSLMDLYYSFTDSVSNDDIKKAYAEDNNGEKFPIPDVMGGDRRSVVVQPTEDQIELLNQTIHDFDALPYISDPYERNIARLRLMDRARKLSLDVRAAVRGHQGKEKGGKLEKIAEEAVRIYKKWDAEKGTQLIFLDRSVPKSRGDDKIIKDYDALIAERDRALAMDDEAELQRLADALDKFDANEIAELRAAQDGGWNAYQQIKDNLVASGIPANEIRFIQEANNDAQKQAMFDAVNAGEIRILIGSTPRMGAGTNVQRRLVGLNHADVTWKPSDIEQREGRIIRQGNLFASPRMDGAINPRFIPGFEVEILAYATERTIDAKMWSLNAAKLKTINAIRNYDGSFSMDFEDEDSVSMAEMAALASGNPLLMERVKLTSEIDKLDIMKRQYQRKMWAYKGRLEDAELAIKNAPAQNETLLRRADEAQAGEELLRASLASRSVTVEGETFKDYASAAKAVHSAIEQQQAGDKGAKVSIKVGERRLTSLNGALDAVSTELGDESPFLGELSGVEHISRTSFARELAKAATEAIPTVDAGQSKVIATGKLRGFTFEASLENRGWGRSIELALVDSQGKTVATRGSRTQASDETKFVTTSSLTNPLSRLDESVSAEQLRRWARDALAEAERAKKEIPDLQEKASKPFPQAQELAEKTDRLNEVISLLSSDVVKDRPSVTPDALILSPQEFEDRFGVAPSFSDGFAVMSPGGGAYQNQPSGTFTTREAAQAWIDSQLSGQQKDGDPGAGAFSRAAERNDATGFYSALAREIDALPTKAAPAPGWQMAIQGMVKNGKVKADELEWSGLTDWLKLQTGKVTKEQITGYLDANGVQVQEVTLGINERRKKGEFLANEFKRLLVEKAGFSQGDASIEVRRQREDRFAPVKKWADQDVFAAATALKEADGNTELNPKYEKYTLSGGENYREVLLTLPSAKDELAVVRHPDGEGYALQRPDGTYVVSGPESVVPGTVKRWDSKHFAQEYGKDAHDKVRATQFKSGHWDQQNVLAHIRVNDRTDADGKRVLFVEEIQSDWGQQGKRDGFGGGTHKAGDKFTVMRNGEPRSVTALKNTENNLTLVEDGNGSRFNVGSGEGVPQAPFVTHTDKWLALALKRIVKMAVDGGYDRVAFVNGQQSAERFSLDKELSELRYEPAGEGLYEIAAIDHDGVEVISEDNITIDRVEELVGKEMAEKIANGEGEKGTEGGYRDWRSFSGDGLKIEAKGMRAFYDQIVPSATKALLKKLGGGQMESVRIPGKPRMTLTSFLDYSIGHGDFRSPAELEAAWDTRDYGRNTDAGVKRYLADVDFLTQPGFTITPAMQEKASGGLPLFRRQLAKFSRGAQQQANTAVQSTVDKLTADWQNKPEIVIAFDMQDEAIPENVRLEDAKQRSGGAFGNPEGFYYRGVVYLLSSQLATDADIARVLAHESLGHYGLRGLYGKALKPILQQIATMRRADVIAVARQRGLVKVDGNNRPIVDVKTATNAQVWAAMTDSHKSQSAEEVLAEMAQTTPQAGFVKRAVAAIRQWLREHGVNLKLTDNDIIVNYILPARGWVERGPGGGGPKGGVSFARGAKSGDAENTRYTRQWYDRLVSLLPDSYRNDPYRREPLPAEGRDVQQAREVQDKIDALNKQIRGPRDTKGHGPVTRDELGNLTVDAREATYSEIIGEIKDLADEIGYGVTVTGVQRRLIEKFRQAGFESEISLAAIADRITGVRAEISDEKSVYAVQALGTIMSYKPRGFPMALFSRAVVNDPANPDIRFSRATTARDLTQKATDAVRVFTNTPGKVNWWHKTVGTQYNLAQRSPEFKRVYDAVQDFIGDVSFYATEAADLAPKILPKLDTWRDIAKSPLSADDTKAIAAPIFEGTLVWARNEAGKPVKVAQLEEEAALMSSDRKAQRLLRNDKISEGVLKMWRGLPLEQYEALIDSKYEKEMLKAGVVWSDAELRSQFSLSDAQIALYREFRAATDKSLTNLAISDMLYFGGKDVAPIKEAVLEAKTVTEAAEMLRSYLMSLADMDPDNAESLIATANKMIDKGDRAADLMARGYAPLSRFGTYTLDVVDANGERVYFGLFESRMEADRMAKQMAAEYPGGRVEQGTLSEESYKLFAGVSPETVALFGDMLGLEDNGAYQDYLKLAKSTRSAMKRLIERKGIAGFSEDAGRVLAGFVYSNARQTSQNMHTGEMVQAANDIPNGMGELKDKATQLVEYIKHPVEEAQKVRGLLFAQYIGGSVASAMVNMTQPFTMTMPWLSQFGGLSKAAKQMSAAVKDATRKTTGNPALDAALKRGEEDGTVSPQEVHDLMRQAQGKGALKSGDGTKLGNATATAQNAVSRIAFAWGKLFSTAEQFNRRVTFIAAYRTAVEQGMSNPDSFARRAIHETQGVYNKGNKPDWARGAVGSTLFTFKQYSIAYVEMLHRMATTGAPGSPERAAGRRGALYALAVLVLLSGVGGLPGADDLDDIISGLMQSLGYNFDSKAKRKAFLAEYLGDGAQQFIERGVSGIYGVPIDVSGRLGLGNLVPATGLLTKKTDHTSDVAELLGPAGDLAKRAFQAGGKLIEGDVLGTHGAVATASPKAVQNLFQAADMATTGMYRDARGKKVIETSPGDALSKALGFQPNDVKRQQDATWEVKRMVDLNRITEAEIAERWAIGLFEKDADKVQAARDDLARWNADNPDSPISIKFSQILQRVRSMNQTKAERIAKSAPKELRAQVREALSQQ